MKKPVIAIRREDKNIWERRAPLTPDDVEMLIREQSLGFVVQPSPIRVFCDELYESAGAAIHEDLSSADLVIGVKEMPEETFRTGGTYLFFSHTIKGQPYNMPMLKRLMELGCNLVDYETIADEKGLRLVFFGTHAGLAGMIDGLWLLGQRLSSEGHETPLAAIKQAKEYSSLEEAESRIREAGEALGRKGLPSSLPPLVVGFAGYGNVSQGAQEILDLLPHREVTPEELPGLCDRADNSGLWKVVFKEEHMAEPRDPGRSFVLQEYYDSPEQFQGIFSRYVPHLSVLVNCIFWTEKYPRLVSRELLRELFAGESPRLRVIADLSCDVGGSIECTLKCTDSGTPAYVYLPDEDRIVDGWEGRGPVVLAVDNLPCEIPKDSTEHFSRAVRDFLPELATCDFARPFEKLELSPPLRRALIVHQGRLTPGYEYLEEKLSTL